MSIQELARRVGTAGSFAGCLVSQDVNDEAGHQLVNATDVLRSRLLGLRTRLESFALQQEDGEFRAWLEDEGLKPISFYLEELRRRGREKLPPEQERLVQELAVDGYHAWNRLYQKMAGELTVEFEEDGQTRTISLGQLATYLSNVRRDLRRQAFEKLERAWESRASLAAMALNAQAGFRLTLYRNRNWQSVLHEPLSLGRLKPETLEALWSAVADGVPRLAEYAAAKKRLLGIDKLFWYDQVAPIGSTHRSFEFDQAGRFIVEQLGGFSPEMAEFTEMALSRRWIEARNRPGKAGGGFCTDFPTHRQTRIFMTWGGQYDHLLTLAHELGHAYHGWVLRDAPYFNQHYPMNLAETASTFNELRVTDAALRSAGDERERLMLLDQKLKNAYTMFCNLRSRYLFDTAFYAERKRGAVPRERLDQLMVEAQRQGYGGTLADPEGFHPLFWASKMHFFITDYPFYNFPYVFGYLFANGIYHQALSSGADFAERYRNLLIDTGSMTTEDIASKHLGVDLTGRRFWDAAVERVLADLGPFLELAGRAL